MKTTLVTGGAGFIGSHFVERLLAYDKVVVLDAFTYASNPLNLAGVMGDPRFELVRGDIRDVALVDATVARADRVVHFAAESHVTRSIVDDLAFFETDVMGTRAIAAAVAKHHARIERFVHISTSEVYGTAEAVPMTEDHPLKPCTPYAAAKAGADRLVYAYGRTHGVPLVILRPFNNYGPRQHLEKVVPRFIASALMDRPLLVHGDGSMTRDWLYVEDTCAAVLRALEANVVGEVINLGTGRDVSVLAIAKAVLGVLDKPESLIEHVAPRPGQVDRHVASTARARALLDWKAQVGLECGLVETIRWYADNRTWWAETLAASEVSVMDRAGVARSF